MIRARGYRESDEAEWVRMRSELWPEIDANAEEDAREWLKREDAAVLLLRMPVCCAASLRLASVRTLTDAYLEGWFVAPELRRSGVGALLVEAATEWARGRGYREFASDALLENTASHRAHEALGFEEVERAVRYRKIL